VERLETDPSGRAVSKVERGILGLDGYQTEYAVDREQYVVRIPAGLELVGVLMEPLSVVEKAIELLD
jgi:hypothetical protein